MFRGKVMISTEIQKNGIKIANNFVKSFLMVNLILGEYFQISIQIQDTKETRGTQFVKSFSTNKE